MKLSVSRVFNAEMMLRRQSGAPLYRLAYPRLDNPQPFTHHRAGKSRFSNGPAPADKAPPDTGSICICSETGARVVCVFDQIPPVLIITEDFPTLDTTTYDMV